MKKIQSLTPEQESLFSVYRDRWLKIGLATGPADKPKAEDALRRAYRVVGLEPPKQIIWAPSPLSGSITISILKNDDLMKKIYADFQKLLNFKFKLKPKRLLKTGDSVWASVWASVRDSVWASVGASVGDSVGASVRASVRDSVGASVWASVGDSVEGEPYRAGYGSHDAAWLGFYQYFLEILKIKSCEKLIPLMDLAKEGGWFYPYKNICVISERPLEIHMNGTGIHKDGGPAIRYSDDFSVWALHGVRVPRWLAETASDKLDSAAILKLTNAQQRAEGIRKIGINRMLELLKTEVIHQFKDYDLLTIEFEGRRIGPYLKMLNPSTGQIHVEGVGEANGGIDSSIKTCQEALAWRGNLKVYSDPLWIA